MMRFNGPSHLKLGVLPSKTAPYRRRILLTAVTAAMHPRQCTLHWCRGPVGLKCRSDIYARSAYFDSVSMTDSDFDYITRVTM